MSRIILLAGPGGAGTSTITAATCRSAAEAGLSTHSVDAGDPDRALDPDLRGLLGMTVGAMALSAGADRLLPEAWSSLPGVRLLAVLEEVRRAAIDHDLVVVDAGSLVALRELLDLPHVLLRLLDATLTPRSAMTGPDGGALFDALSEARLRMLHLVSLLSSRGTSVRLVGRPTDDAVLPLVTSAATTVLLGATVDGVVLPCFPRRKDGAPEARRLEARRVETELQVALPEIPVWRSFTRPRPVPKGRVVTEVLSDDNAVAPVGDPTPVGDGFHWDVRMPSAVTDEVRAGTQAGSLVLEYRGVHRWIDLPSVLKRCVPVAGERTETGLSLEWSPDAAVWPASRHDAGGHDG